MIINKVTYTEEEQQKLSSYITEYQKNISAFVKDFNSNEPTEKQIANNSNMLLPELAEYVGKILLIYRQALDRYIKSFNGDYRLVISDIEDVVDRFEKEDYLTVNKGINIVNPALMYAYFIDIQTAADTEKNDDKNEIEEKKYIETLLKILHPQLEALKYCSAENAQLDITQIIKAKVEKVYNISGDIETPDLPQLNILNKGFFPIYNGNITNGLISINKSSFTVSENGKDAIAETPSGVKIIVKEFGVLNGLGTTANKIFDKGIEYITKINHSKAIEDINPTAELSVLEWGIQSKYFKDGAPITKQKIKDLKQQIKRDLEDFAIISISGEETKGKNKGNYSFSRIISSYKIWGDRIIINFDIDVARYLAKSYIAYLPAAAYGLPNNNPNAYAIIKKLCLHHSNDQNFRAGTNSTLSVSALLKAAPNIQSIEELKNRNQRDWKQKIKKPLETSLNLGVQYKILSKWEYRQPENSTTYTSEQANNLTWETYSRLMVDFVLIDAPDQTERRTKIAEQIAATKEADEKNNTSKNKRGRPKKTTNG